MTEMDVIAIQDLVAEWRSIVGRSDPGTDVRAWQSVFEQLISTQTRFLSEGQWVSGYSDLMHLARVADGELTH